MARSEAERLPHHRSTAITRTLGHPRVWVVAALVALGIVAVGIAAKGNGHIALLSQLATVLLDPEKAAALRGATTPDQVYDLLASDEDDE